MQILQRARFFAGPIDHYRNNQITDPVRPDSIIQPAILDLDGIRFHSEVPTSAAQAAKINERIAEWEKMLFKPEAL